MKFDSLKVTNFRNYDKVSLKFSPYINIIYGKNGSGKTNIVEALYVLALTRSFRTKDDINLIKKEELSTKIEGKVKINKSDNYQVIINKEGKKVKINNIQEYKISNYISNINVNIDYPEYDDVKIISHNILKPNVLEIKEKIEKIIAESKNGKIIKNGLKVSIVGKPNVGKSSLLNALLEEEKAIVTDIAGTTRDIIEGTISLQGIVLNFIDTAGIRKTEDIVEQFEQEQEEKSCAPTRRDAGGKTKQQDDDYIGLYLGRNEIKTRQCVYISRDVHSVILKIVNSIAPEDTTVGGYIDTVLRFHLQQHKDRINELYKKQRDNLI